MKLLYKRRDSDIICIISSIAIIQLLTISTIAITAQQQSESGTFKQVKRNAKVVGVEPIYNQTLSTSTECYLECSRQPEKCSLVEVKNANEVWSCRLFTLNSTTTKAIEDYLQDSPGTEVAKLIFPAEDCAELKRRGNTRNGVYTISHKEWRKRQVYCDMTTEGGGWIVIQNRIDGSVEFNRTWNAYKDGFGELKKEFWAGNEFVHRYTKTFPSTEMIAEGAVFDGTRVAVKIQRFRLSNEASKYTLQFDSCIKLESPIKDPCTDWMEGQKGSRFSTLDQDNDDKAEESCAQEFSSGWWFAHCFWVNLNGRYSQVETIQNEGTAIHWASAFTMSRSLRSTRILIRRLH